MPEPTPASVASPDKLGHYRIVRELGRGGMGCVYEAVHEHLQRRVAIKLMRPELAADPKQVERFVREGQAACHIRHPHVIDVFELGFEQAAPYLVMDYLPGITLAERLREAKRLELPELISVLVPVVSAVAAAHAAGVVHRDLKPDNIMLTRDARGRCVPKVLDFGISKVLSQDVGSLALTTTSAVLGTPYYMSPEQTRASRQVDARSDQYALGVILYECATGQRPFQADNAFELVHAIMTAPVVAPSDLIPSLPRELDTVIERAMQRVPSERYASVTELGAALLKLAPAGVAEAFREEFGPEPPRPPDHTGARTLSKTLLTGHDTPRAGQTERRTSKLRLTLAALTLALLMACYAMWRGQSAAHSPERTHDRDAAASVLEPAPPTAAPSGPVVTNEAATLPVGVESSANDRALEPAAPAATAEPAPPRPEPARPRAAASGTRARQPPPKAAAQPAPARRADPVTFGENGAPILE